MVQGEIIYEEEKSEDIKKVMDTFQSEVSLEPFQSAPPMHMLASVELITRNKCPASYDLLSLKRNVSSPSESVTLLYCPLVNFLLVPLYLDWR